MGATSGTGLPLRSAALDPRAFLRRFLEELKPLEDRSGATLRIVVASMLVWFVMLTFRNPRTDIGVFMVFMFMQRSTLMTRLIALLAVVSMALTSLSIIGIACLSWNVPWLRILLWFALFWSCYFLMSRLPKIGIIFLMPIAFGAVFCFGFDKGPNPNWLVSQLGWLWCAVGLAMFFTVLCQHLFGAPTALDLLRSLVRRMLNLVESHCLQRASGTLSPQALGVIGMALDQAKMLRKFGELTPLQAENCQRILGKVIAIDRIAFEGDLSVRPGDSERAQWIHVARHLARLRKRLLNGEEWHRAKNDSAEVSGTHSFDNEQLAEAMKELMDAESRLDATGEGRGDPAEKMTEKPAVTPKKDFKDTEFATRATLATMACYMFASMTDWSGIETCMITCAVTAMNDVESQVFKQRLRIIGASVGGLMGFLAMFLIPHMDNLTGVALIVASGVALSAWIAMGREKYSYIGIQMALAFVMLVMQDPHATTGFTVIRDRLVGIMVGLFAMRCAFIWWTPKYIRGVEPAAAPRLSPI